MGDSQEIEIETQDQAGVICGEVHVFWTIEDNSFDHEFGTRQEYAVVLDESEGFDLSDLRFYPYENEGKGQKLTKEQEEEIEGCLESELTAPDLNDIAEANDPRL